MFCILYVKPWCTSQAGLVRLPLNRLLDYLKPLARRKFLAANLDPDQGVLEVD